MKTMLAFKGNYQSEFGGNKSRPWSVHRVFNGDSEIGMLYIEPEDYPSRYHVYKGGGETTGERIGGYYKTQAEALQALIN